MDSAVVETVTQAIAQPCGRCNGKGSERHQVSRDPSEGSEDWPCPNCRGVGLTVRHGTPEEVARIVVAALEARGYSLSPEAAL